MPVHKLTEETKIKPGQWVCPKPFFDRRICDEPRQVASASGQRVYLTESDGRNLGNFIARKSVVYLCDTAEEAAAVHAISREQCAAITASTKAIKAAHNAKIEALHAGAAMTRA